MVDVVSVFSRPLDQSKQLQVSMATVVHSQNQVGPSSHHSTTVVVAGGMMQQQQPEAKPLKDWDTGICGCFEDCGDCE